MPLHELTIGLEKAAFVVFAFLYDNIFASQVLPWRTAPASQKRHT